jgi:hypothetical protein
MVGQISFKRLSSTGNRKKANTLSLPARSLAFVCSSLTNEKQRSSSSYCSLEIEKNKRKVNTPLLPRMTFKQE